jgi:hypothetical protein
MPFLAFPGPENGQKRSKNVTRFLALCHFVAGLNLDFLAQQKVKESDALVDHTLKRLKTFPRG